LPNRKELESLLDLGQYSPALPPGYPFSGVQSYGFWSSSPSAGSPSYAWIVNFYGGFVFYDYKAGTYYVWPVRGGQ